MHDPVDAPPALVAGPSAQPSTPPVAPMLNPVRDYDWGSATVLAELQGREPTGAPEAELWMGAHPSAPSSLSFAIDRDGDRVAALVPLPEVVAADPEGVLGERVVGRFGARLPFMLKVLAVAKPLSLQVHPDARRAAKVHGTPGSPYVDPFHKPELIVAVDEMEALFGFRPAAVAASLLHRLGGERARPLARGLMAGVEAGLPDRDVLHSALAQLLDWPAADRAALVSGAVSAAAAARAGDDVAEHAAHWLRELARLHPGDPLALAPLLLELVQLEPGEALFVPAGVPHAYLTGCGVEVLAASDNVVRAGLTSKAVAVEELLRIVDSRPGNQNLTVPEVLGEHEVAWRPKVPDFQLARLHVPGGEPVACAESVAGPQVLLCTRGELTVSSASAGGVSVTLTAGQSAFATASAGPLTVAGEGELYRAAPGL